MTIPAKTIAPASADREATPPEPTERLRGALTTNMVSQGVRVICTATILFLISRVFSDTEIGIYLMIQSAAIVGARLYTFGLNRAIVPRFFNEPNLDRWITNAAAAIGRNVRFFGIFHLAAAGLMLRSFDISMDRALLWTALVVVWSLSISISQVWAEVFRAGENHTYAAALQGMAGGALAGVANLTMVVALAAAGQLRITTLVLTSLVATATPAIVAGRPHLRRSSLLPANEVTELAKSARPAGVSLFVTLLGNEAPLWIAAFAFGSAAVAPLAFAKRLSAQATLLPNIVANATSARSFRAIREGRQVEFGRTLSRLFTPLAALIAIAIAVAVAVPAIVDTIAGPNLSQTSTYLVILAAPALLMTILGFPAVVLHMTDGARASAAVITAVTICGVGAAAVLSQISGPVAIAIAMALTASIPVVADYVLLRRGSKFDASIRSFVLPRSRQHRGSA